MLRRGWLIATLLVGNSFRAALAQDLTDLNARQSAAMTAFSQTIQVLGPVLKEQGLEVASVNRVIFSHYKDGTIAHAALLKAQLTKKDILRGTHVVGVFVNTVALRDHKTNKELPAGVYVVRLQVQPNHGATFDFVDRDGKVVGSVHAFLENPSQFARAKGDQPVSAIRIFDVEWNGEFCVSFLWWKHCWPWE